MYCTLDDIRSRRLTETLLVQLTDDKEFGVVDTTVVDDAIAEAGEIIDGYLRNRYPLPLASVPGLLRNIAVDLATYALYGRGRCDTPERVADDRSQAIKLLIAIQAGTVGLGVDAPDARTKVEGPESMQVTCPARVFDADTLEKY